MATYREIQDRVRFHDGFVPKTSWIAHVMADHGLTKRHAPNRTSPTKRKHPCPEERRSAIVVALRYFMKIR
jgi:hypothetical protein